MQHKPRFAWDMAVAGGNSGLSDGVGGAEEVEDDNVRNNKQDGRASTCARGSKEKNCRLVAKDIMDRSGLQRELLFNGEGEMDLDVDDDLLAGTFVWMARSWWLHSILVMMGGWMTWQKNVWEAAHATMVS